MAKVTKGEEFVYGIDGTIAGTAVQSVGEEYSFANTATVENEQGNVISRHYDDIHRELTLEFKTKASYSLPAMGSDIEWKEVIYTIESISDKWGNKEFRGCTLKCKKSEYIR